MENVTIEMPTTEKPANIIHADCRDAMAAMLPEIVDSIVCDPPYGLSNKAGTAGFMGQAWDHGVPGVEFWQAALRVAKPGTHLLAFGGSRTFHRLMCAIEDAGWECRDTIMWLYGSGWPKSLDVSKAIDKAAGATRERLGRKDELGVVHSLGRANETKNAGWRRPWMDDPEADAHHVTVPATADAKKWAGFGSALKPAFEIVIVARKPLIGTVAQNVLRYGTGALNIDGCRVESDVSTITAHRADIGFHGGLKAAGTGYVTGSNLGRWPANLIHDGSEEVRAGFPQSKGQQGDVRGTEASRTGGDGTNCYGEFGRVAAAPKRGDSGSAARFFYTAKASKADREPGNSHPCVKPTDLMRYLCRLVTPPGGIVFDPFCGSGSTGKAAVLEGFDFIGIEQDAAYVEIARKRIARACQEHNSGSLFTRTPDS